MSNSSSHVADVAIVGGGIGGLTAALALLQAGVDVDVYERAPRLTEVGAGVQLSANASRVLRHLGLESALLRVAGESVAKEIRLWNSGRAFSVIDTGAESVARYGAPYLMLHRHDLQHTLVDAIRALKPEAIRLDAPCVSVDQDDLQARAHLADGRIALARCIVGADGIHSRVRASLFGSQSPSFTGCVAWRGMIPVQRLGGSGRAGVAANWIGPGRHVITYPVRRGELLNFVGIVRRPDWAVESWTERGTHDECLADFEGWHDEVRRMIQAIEQPYKWALMARAPLARWADRRITLMGDACHPTLPFLGSGAAMAIEDAAVLARCLVPAGSGVAAALARYEAARIARTTQIVQRSAAMLDVFQGHHLQDAAEAAAYVEREWAPDRVRERYDWLFGYDPLTTEI